MAVMPHMFPLGDMQHREAYGYGTPSTAAHIRKLLLAKRRVHPSSAFFLLDLNSIQL